MRLCGDVKKMLHDYQGALQDLDKTNVLELNDAFTLTNHGSVKMLLKDYQGTLENLDKTDVLELIDAFTFDKSWKCQNVVEGLSRNLGRS